MNRHAPAPPCSRWKLGLLAFAVAALAGCGGGGGGDSGGYPANVKKNYLHSCEVNSSAKICNCTFAWIEKHVSLSRFEAADRAINHGSKRAPAWVYTAVHACVHT